MRSGGPPGAFARASRPLGKVSRGQLGAQLAKVNRAEYTLAGVSTRGAENRG